jgi:hypothetical protein
MRTGRRLGDIEDPLIDKLDPPTLSLSAIDCNEVDPSDHVRVRLSSSTHDQSGDAAILDGGWICSMFSLAGATAPHVEVSMEVLHREGHRRGVPFYSR